MINVVYLVLVFGGYSDSSITIQQANMKQCEINKKLLSGNHRVKKSYCIVGVK